MRLFSRSFGLVLPILSVFALTAYNTMAQSETFAQVPNPIPTKVPNPVPTQVPNPLENLTPTPTSSPSPMTDTDMSTSEDKDTTASEITITPSLTAEQKAKMQVIDANYDPKIKAALESYEMSKKAFDSLVGTNPPTEALRQKYTQLADDRRQLSDLLFGQMMDMREILTEEQKASLSDEIRRVLAEK